MADNFFMRWFGPEFANGMDLRLWLHLLAENRFRVAAPYLGRAATITVAATLNTAVEAFEKIRFGRAIDGTQVHPPLFVLGAARSGTTHLHTVLAQDERFAFPNTFQALNPRIFLSTEWWSAPIQQVFFPETRPMDNMRYGVGTPAEDELAIMGLCELSPFNGWLFPASEPGYDKYFDFSTVSDEERERWKQTLLYFLKKLTLKNNKPLILKSPSNTSRVSMLLDLFPDAKFVHIHRHPYEVYVSMINLARKVLPVAGVQRWNWDKELGRILSVYRLYLDGYFEQRNLIPKGNLIEIAYRDLEDSPMSTVRTIYERLNLPSFDEAQSAI